jgi:hypothetical protein
MSEENVETIRKGYEAMNSALASGEDLLPLMGGIDPDVVVEMAFWRARSTDAKDSSNSLRDRLRSSTTCAATPRRSSTRARASSFPCA